MKYKKRIEEIFKAWTDRNWEFVRDGLAEDFTFTSPHDALINKENFKEKCWDNIEQIGEFEIVAISENGSEAFVRYKNTLNGEKVQNAEHFIFDTKEKIKSVTVFFGRP